MRVKLSYTVDDKDVLKEAAKIINLSADDMQQAISLFNQVQEELRGGDEEENIPSITKSLEMIEEFRSALLNMDTRLSEVVEIVGAYNAFLSAQLLEKSAGQTAPVPEEGEVEQVVGND